MNYCWYILLGMYIVYSQDQSLFERVDQHILTGEYINHLMEWLFKACAIFIIIFLLLFYKF